MTYDLAIIGGGPAGVSAGVYAARKKLKTVFITENFGGQSIVSDSIENWIGTPSISGADLAKQLETHLRTYAKNIVDIQTDKRVVQVSKITEGFEIILSDNSKIDTKTILVTTGSHRRQLQIPGADKFEHKGLTYCASCDGPIFTDQNVAVIGGGNAGFETAAQLLAYAKSVTLLHRRGEFKADPITVQTVLQDPKMSVLTPTEPTEVLGDKFVTALRYKNLETGVESELAVSGIFVEIGSIPTTEFVKDLVDTNEYGAIKIDFKNQKTSQIGIWAAGDCTDTLYHQNNIAAGDAVRALEDIYLFIKTGK
jgi:alkyl hydroperoxide reductase subunit F